MLRVRLNTGLRRTRAPFGIPLFRLIDPDCNVALQIDVVAEKRLYCSWGEQTRLATGIVAARRAINHLHYDLGARNFSQVLSSLLSLRCWK